jgi:tetratricopeptide (TPR) repeat protein
VRQKVSDTKAGTNMGATTASQLTASEEAQLFQTIEMFEVITQSQPQDYQSLEILKEAYAKLGREQDVVNTSKRIAQAYVTMGQLSSAILEYESILQRYPEDSDVLNALGEIESKANTLSGQSSLGGETTITPKNAGRKPGSRFASTDGDDGRQTLHKIFVEGKIITNAQFEECWIKHDFTVTPTKPLEPFIHVLAEKNITPLERAMRIISDKSRVGFLPLDKYDIDMDLARGYPAETCHRWCVLPFDRLSKSVMVATANPFNRQAAAELEEVTKQRLLWYLAPPQDMMKILKKVFR